MVSQDQGFAFRLLKDYFFRYSCNDLLTSITKRVFFTLKISRAQLT